MSDETQEITKRRVAFSGSRLPCPVRRGGVLKAFSKLNPLSDIILVGDCPTGVDMWVGEEARRYGFELWPFKADWLTHGRKAGPIRNREMVSQANILVAFPCRPEEGASPGTRSAMAIAHELGIRVIEFK